MSAEGCTGGPEMKSPNSTWRHSRWLGSPAAAAQGATWEPTTAGVFIGSLSGSGRPPGER